MILTSSARAATARTARTARRRRRGSRGGVCGGPCGAWAAGGTRGAGGVVAGCAAEVVVCWARRARARAPTPRPSRACCGREAVPEARFRSSPRAICSGMRFRAGVRSAPRLSATRTAGSSCPTPSSSTPCSRDWIAARQQRPVLMVQIQRRPRRRCGPS